MKSLISNFTDAIGNLSLVDMVFFVALLILFILIFIILYIIKINSCNQIDNINDSDLNTKTNESNIPIINSLPENKTIISDNQKNYLYDDEDTAIIDLSSLKKKMDSIPNNVTLEQYEKEQEDSAIISYEELLKRQKSNQNINYINEKLVDDEVLVKQIDVNSTTKSIENVTISIVEEENFLNMLNQLLNTLN